MKTEATKHGHTEAQSRAGEREGHNGGHDEGGHDGHGVDHSGHEGMFRRRFFVSLVLSIPVLLYSEGLQTILGFSTPAFPGSEWFRLGKKRTPEDDDRVTVTESERTPSGDRALSDGAGTVLEQPAATTDGDESVRLTVAVETPAARAIS